MIRLEKNGARMVRWMCNIRPEEKLSAEELKTEFKLNSMRDCLLDRRLQWFGYTERMEGSAWSSKCRTFKIIGSFPRGQPRKTDENRQNEVIRSDMKIRKVSKAIDKERNASKSFIRNHPNHASMEN